MGSHHGPARSYRRESQWKITRMLSFAGRNHVQRIWEKVMRRSSPVAINQVPINMADDNAKHDISP